MLEDESASGNGDDQWSYDVFESIAEDVSYHYFDFINYYLNLIDSHLLI